MHRDKGELHNRVLVLPGFLDVVMMVVVVLWRTYNGVALILICWMLVCLKRDDYKKEYINMNEMQSCVQMSTTTNTNYWITTSHNYKTNYAYIGVPSPPNTHNTTHHTAKHNNKLHTQLIKSHNEQTSLNSIIRPHSHTQQITETNLIPLHTNRPLRFVDKTHPSPAFFLVIILREAYLL